MASDPLSRLIELLSTAAPMQSPQPGPAGGPADSGPAPLANPSRLSQAAALVGERAPSAVPDVRDSALLATFRRQHAAGLVESAVLDAAIDTLRLLLTSRGIAL